MSNRKKNTVESDSSHTAIRTEDPPDVKARSKMGRVIALPNDNAISFADNERAVRPKRSTNDDLYSKTERTLGEDDLANMEQQFETSTTKQKSELVKVVTVISALKRSKSIGKAKRKKSRKRGMTSSDYAVRTEPPIQNLQSKTEMNLTSLNEKCESYKGNEVVIKTDPPNIEDADISSIEPSKTEKLKNKRRKPLKPNKEHAVKDRKKRKKSKKKSVGVSLDLSDKALRTLPANGNMLSVSRTKNDLDDFSTGPDGLTISYVPTYFENTENPDNLPVAVADKSIKQKKWLKIFFGLAVFVYSIVFGFQMWRILNALAATYEVSIDDCQFANSLCQRYSMCCFNQCGSSRLETFWSKLLNG